ncbi:MAG: F-box protein [Gammaproteobacteria bacterium]|nr:F-box protein [Gammaproteobacteria bacterium]
MSMNRREINSEVPNWLDMNNNNHVDSLALLSDEIILHMMSFLDYKSILRTQMTCHRMNYIGNDAHLWRRQINNFFSWQGKLVSDEENVISKELYNRLQIHLNRRKSCIGFVPQLGDGTLDPIRFLNSPNYFEFILSPRIWDMNGYHTLPPVGHDKLTFIFLDLVPQETKQLFEKFKKSDTLSSSEKFEEFAKHIISIESQKEEYFVTFQDGKLAKAPGYLPYQLDERAFEMKAQIGLGDGKALFISGPDSNLGECKSAIRLKNDGTDHWSIHLDKGIKGFDFKFYVGQLSSGDNPPVTELIAEYGPFRKIKSNFKLIIDDFIEQPRLSL